MKKKIFTLLIFIIVFQMIALIIWYFFDRSLFLALALGSIVSYFVTRKKETPKKAS